VSILEAITYATQRTRSDVRAATNWIWHRDIEAYSTLKASRRPGCVELAERLLDLTLGSSA
jgi:hypothetical protein